jgi:hypothetical protein
MGIHTLAMLAKVWSTLAKVFFVLTTAPRRLRCKAACVALQRNRSDAWRPTDRASAGGLRHERARSGSGRHVCQGAEYLAKMANMRIACRKSRMRHGFWRPSMFAKLAKVWQRCLIVGKDASHALRVRCKAVCVCRAMQSIS